MRAKYINEKFSEKTDPIADLGVGGIAFGVLKYQMHQDIKKQWEEKINQLLLGKTIYGKLNHYMIGNKEKGTMKEGKGWGNYKIKVSYIAKDMDFFNDTGIFVYEEDENFINSYLIPFDEEKIHIL